jgi:DNA-binding transcriptional ArsR family regulator
MPHRNGTGIALLADPTRRRIIATLAVRPQRSSELARRIGLSRPAVSRQLRLLRGAGLVIDHRMPIDRRERFYSVDFRRYGAIIAWLAATDVGRPSADPDAAAGIVPPPREDADIPPDPDGDD